MEGSPKRALPLGSQSGDSPNVWRATSKRSATDPGDDQGIYGHLTRRNLAPLATARNAPAEAAQLWEEVLAEWPGDPDADRELAALTANMSTVTA